MTVENYSSAFGVSRVCVRGTFVRLYGLRCMVVRDAILLSVSPKPTIGKC